MKVRVITAEMVQEQLPKDWQKYAPNVVDACIAYIYDNFKVIASYERKGQPRFVISAQGKGE